MPEFEKLFALNPVIFPANMIIDEGLKIPGITANQV